MSQRPSLTINFGLPEQQSESPDLLLIEQEDWQPYNGRLTKANMARKLAELLYSEEYAQLIECEVLPNGDVVAAVYVYRLRPGVVYQLHVTHGLLAGPDPEVVDLDETVHFNLEMETSLRYPSSSVQSAVWASSYSADGVPVPSPAVTIDGRTITVTASVYGSLRVRYRARRDVYILTIPRRDDAIENFYSAYLVGLPVGGRPVFVQFDPPPTAEEMAEDGTECGRGGGSSSVTWPEHPLDDVTADRHHRLILVDYCSQTVMMDETT